MRISESKIEEIRNAANIVDVVSEYVQLRKRGRNYIGLCPFHSEKTPSFTVSDEKQIYHCFGCHNGGNVFKFLMEYKKISFVEAVQELADQYGIELNFDDSIPEGQSEQETLFDINTEVARYFSNNLLNDDEGQIAREYFQKRNIKVQTMRAFGLGYALNGWENLVSFLKQKNIDLEKALQLGLIGRNKDGRVYDKLAGRIIFPIFSPNGRVVAFAGRKLREDDTGAKYINSPESIIYVKGRVLYGLSFAKDEIRKLDKAIIVEGYMDLISLYQAGIKNVVAVSGTALTDEQAQLLSRYTKNVVLLFDADTAGIAASMRSIEILLRKDFDVKIATLPAGEDPDSFVNKYGKEEFEETIKRAENFLEYQTAYFEKQGMFVDPTKAAEAIRELVKPIAIIDDELKRNILIKAISKKFNLREKLLEKELEKALEQEKKIARTQTQRIYKEENISQKVLIPEKIKSIPPQFYNIEKEIIKLLFENDSVIIELILQHIEQENLELEIHRTVFEKIKTYFSEQGNSNPADLISLFDDETQAYLREITIEQHTLSHTWFEKHPSINSENNLYRYAADIITKFRQLHIELKISENQKAIENADSEEIALNLMRENQELERKKREIKIEVHGQNF
ncbi:DNA primase [Ignavibacterium album JCM 16511]|uniref:DNA primase n=1 Tax=Ignavibacterium album (strain DSM 19864 / JCM 16511 / NBRC 101810 / Mat9-16) TaxID=945713 RepID=I0AGC8_IGNAJ|nr:DNA primase [Ignavibacterium album]AFH48035.1 DNA primase [Ignavibacterium album JCM 16511]